MAPSVGFEWREAWYPVMPASYADVERPNAFELLGLRLVLWKSGAEWATVANACPHRLAPLSTARVEADGTLRCRFHGWKFDSKGTCVEVPNADKETADKLCGADHTTAESYPTTEAGGLLWVWPTVGAFDAAASVKPAIDAGRAQSWVMTVPPVSYESMVENALDPSHAPFLHEGTFAASEFVPMDRYEIAEEPSASGFSMHHGGYTTKNVGMNATRLFTAPSFVNVTYDLASGTRQNFDLYFSPATPFSTRVMTAIPLPAPPAWAPRWVGDAVHSFFFTSDALWRFSDQDRLVMMNQDLRNPSTKQAAYDVQTPSDRGVATFRSWLKDCAQPLTFSPSTSLLNFDEASSRWHVHVKHSPQCRRTLARVDIATMLFGRSAFASALSAFILAATGRAARGVAPLALALASYGAARWLDRIRRAFFGREPALWREKVYAA